MKIITAIFIAISFALTFCIISAENAAESEYNATSVLLCEATTGQVLYASNPDEKLPIASVTKIMTLLLVAEEIKADKLAMDDIVVASAHANSMDGSVIWLNAGEEMSVYDLTRSVVIASANDACVALAERVSGSEEEFVKRMNVRADELGMTNTHFVNCTGYDDENHYSTASDVAKMAAELRKYDYFDEFLLTRLTYVREGTDRATQLLNTNKMITWYNGITGLKTGTTDNAGYCFVGTAKRGDMELIAVVLGAKSDDERFDIAEKLLDYGFDGFELFTPTYDYEKLTDINVQHGVEKTVKIEPDETIKCLIPKGTSEKVKYLYDLPEFVEAPFEKGQKVGKIIVLLGDETLFLSQISASEGIEELTLAKSFQVIISSFFSV